MMTKEIVAKRKWRYPLSYERDYAKALTAYVDRKFKIIRAFLPEMTAAIESPSAMNARIETVIDEIRRAVENAETMTNAINHSYQLVDRYNEKEFDAIIGSVFGKGIKLNGQPTPGRTDAVDDLAELKDLWVRENLDLIKSIDEDTLQRLKRMMTQAILDNVNGAELTKYLIDDLQDITGVIRSRAALIGTDQVGKLNGRLSQYRQEHTGLTSYIWETCHDSRVRKSHAARNGHRYYWSNPPPDGHPGMPIRCRCVALPVIDVDRIPIRTKRGTFVNVRTEPLGNGIMNKEPAMYPDNIAGVPRGEPMTEADANEGRPNPNFGKGNGYKVNCQSCVVTYEARLRGYNVETLPNPKTADSMLTKLSRNTRLAWVDPKTGKIPDFIPHPSRGGPKTYLKWLEETLEPGNRYTMQVFWKRGNSGHIVHVRKNARKEVEIYDPQTGVIYRNDEMIETKTGKHFSASRYWFGSSGNPLERFLSDVQFTRYGHWRGPEILRVDDKLFNSEVVDKIMQKYKGDG